MAKSKPNGRPATNPDLPAILIGAVEHAEGILLPFPSEQEEKELPTLFQFMTPMVVNDPRYRGQGKTPRVLREPLLLLSWDRRQGAWKVSLSDKIFNLAGSVTCSTLIGALLDTEASLRSNAFPWAQKKIT
jgi:hypothetical protein